MISEEIIKNIDAAAVEIIASDPENLQDIGKLYSIFRAIHQTAQSNDLSLMAEEAERAEGLLKEIMLDQENDKNETFAYLNKIISSLQYMTRPGSETQKSASDDSPQSKETDGAISEKKTFILPEYIDGEIFNEFINEQDNVLEKMETHLLSLEKNPDREIIAELRRIFHTLKGEAAVFELFDIEKLCHKTEDLIDSSEDNLPIDDLLNVKDWLKEVFDALKTRREVLKLEDDKFSFLASEASQNRNSNDGQKQEVPFEQSKEINSNSEPSFTPITGDIDLLTDFLSEVQEHIDNIDNKMLSLESNPKDQELLNAVFRVFHTIKGAAGFLKLDDMAKLAHTTENLLDLARKEEILLEGVKIDVIFESVDVMKALVSKIADAISKGSATYSSVTSLEELVMKISSVASDQITDAVPPSPCQSVEKNEDKTDEQAQAGEPYQISGRTPVSGSGSAAKSGQPQIKAKIKESIKVDSEKLDQLIDAIGELVIIESMIIQDHEMKKISSPMLIQNFRQMNKITRELQQHGMSLRMIPVRATFQKMARVVRDVAKKSNKKIDFVLHGEDTMLDKSVVDKIGDPLIHLVRNSVDHGIEPTVEERKKAGKSETGKIDLVAFHKGGNIYIEIKDDGRGLNRDSIVAKAKEKGLVRDGQNLTDKEISSLIFLPGFSTARQVTDVSGRGVGMDVVRKNIEELRGNVEITTESGRGSVFSLRLPLTLAIIDGMLVRVGAEKYIIPTLSIIESFRPADKDILTVVNRCEMIKIRDTLIPLVRLASIFKIEGSVQNSTEGIVIVVEDSGKKTGLFVDQLLGQQSTVIKSLGSSMKGLPGISGGSIMADGRVGIILDVAGIVKLATKQFAPEN